MEKISKTIKNSIMALTLMMMFILPASALPVATQEQLSAISGTIFNDVNGNGTKDQGDTGLANWTIVLKNSIGSIVKTLITDINGNYTFGDLIAGNYAVEQVLAPDWTRTLPNASGIYNISVAAGENVTGRDFGNIIIMTIPEPSGIPVITNFTPEKSEVTDVVGGATRTFTINVDQLVNVSWQVNGTEISNSTNVINSSFSGNNTIPGIRNVTAVARNANGTASNIWIWNIASFKVPLSISFIDPTPANNSTIMQNYAFLNTSINKNVTAFIDWNNSLMAWWRFNNETDENSTFFRDWSIQENNAGCSGNTCPNLTIGKFGSALAFDGSDDHLHAGNIASGASGTTLVWINPDGNYTENQAVMTGVDNKGSDKTVRYSIILKSPDCPLGDWRTVIANGTASQNICSGQVYNSTIFPSGVWKQVAVTYDGSVVNLYLDDLLVKTINQTVSGAGDAQPYALGSLGGYDVYHFKGKIDDARIYDRALDISEIKASYNTGIYSLSRNFTELSNNTYAFNAFVQNEAGSVNHTETRTVLVTGGSTQTLTTNVTGGSTETLTTNVTGGSTETLTTNVTGGSTETVTVNASE